MDSLIIIPTRVQLSRRRGWRKPENTIVVTRASRHWGNPFVIGKESMFGPVPDAQTAVAFYRRWLTTTHAGRDVLALARKALPSRSLACFCALSSPCHADVLLEFVAQNDFQMDNPELGTANSPVLL